ncbi:MAG: hypothetical protein PHN74_03640 [Candidatus Pacebacteria bacterium]|nr:hypothetical protein [Candidatus Paceibacterota bacterium]
MNLGIIIILITALAFLSNLLNWKFLNSKITYFLYCIGAFIHEISHAIVCIITFAKIERFEVFSRTPQVIHRKSRLPIIGELLISFAPIAGGLLFLFSINNYLLGNYFELPAIYKWQDILSAPLNLISQINFLEWQSWIMILLFINTGAMLGPSLRDLKNVWLPLIILFFIDSAPLVSLGLLAISFILINIAIQIAIIFFLFLLGYLRRVLTSPKSPSW